MADILKFERPKKKEKPKPVEDKVRSFTLICGECGSQRLIVDLERSLDCFGCKRRLDYKAALGKLIGG